MSWKNIIKVVEETGVGDMETYEREQLREEAMNDPEEEEDRQREIIEHSAHEQREQALGKYLEDLVNGIGHAENALITELQDLQISLTDIKAIVKNAFKEHITEPSKKVQNHYNEMRQQLYFE